MLSFKKPRRPRISRRAFVISALAAVPAGALLDACLEQAWVKVRHLRIGQGEPSHRFVHISDLHYRGSRSALERVVSSINTISPDFVCFTGDLIEEKAHTAAALDILSRIKSPLYGIPGNHDFWANIEFDDVARCFASTGGAWLMDRQATTADSKLVVSGASCRSTSTLFPKPVAGKENILLIHYPAWVKQARDRYDLILAGHSHGGQCRLPFYGPPILPFSVENYDRGLFETQAGPLYVNPGIGWFAVPLRFNCRPEITVISL